MAAAAQMFLLGVLITATTITATTTTTTTTTTTRCPKKCDVGSGLQTCDEILSTTDETCSSLGIQGCNCKGCHCNGAIATVTATNPTTTTTTNTTTATTTRCPKKCDVGSGLQTCDEILSTTDETCSSLAKRGCNCAGCQCATSLLRGDGGSSFFDDWPTTSIVGVILIGVGIAWIVAVILIVWQCHFLVLNSNPVCGVAAIAFAVASPLFCLLPGIVLLAISNLDVMGVGFMVFGSLGIVVSIVLFCVAYSGRSRAETRNKWQEGFEKIPACIAAMALAVACPLCFLLPGIILFVVFNE